MTYELKQFIDDAVHASKAKGSPLSSGELAFAEFHARIGNTANLENGYPKLFARCLEHGIEQPWFERLYGNQKPQILEEILRLKSA